MTKGSHDFLKLVACTEEVRTVDFVNLNTIGNGEVFEVTQLEVAVFLGRINLVTDNLDIGSLCHAAHEEQAGTDEANLDGNGQVKDDGKKEGDPKHDDVALRILHDVSERAPTTHAIAYDDKHTSQTGHRDILC